ncbi:TetR/AcrR family transcriptional regulator [Saccharospirillum mangrovi]|uniref:TetR/AcrR family transcriptional regulator n=1 Tax=Saccharospirillum mangrovi TaxID=2161747 RepID=UPI000D393A23|nr:TetR/AcrR family transcriptional regulator [Saccharospirillum mangrovi]
MKRARAPEQKAARRQALLNAAAHCFVDNGYQMPATAQVAEAAGVAKGTVYLYFDSKEAIFLGLLGEHLNRLLTQLRQSAAPDSLAELLCHHALSYIEAEPSFMPLSAQLHATLQQNLDQPTLMHFKRELADALVSTGTWLDNTYGLKTGDGSRGLLHAYAAMLGLWQLLQWPPVLADHADRAEFSALRLSFADELRWSFQRLWPDQP